MLTYKALIKQAHIFGKKFCMNEKPMCSNID